jgi:hypothetical protein
MTANGPVRTTTLRLPEWLAQELEVIADVEGVTRAALTLSALTAYARARKADPQFRTRLAAKMEENRRLMERMSTVRPERGTR